MAFLKRMKKKDIRRYFTHYGLYWGVVPVYVDWRDPECPGIATRNWIPEWTMDAVDWLTAIPIGLVSIINPDYQPMFAIKLTALIEDDE